MSWLDALLEPSQLIRDAQVSDSPTPPVGLALLLDNQLSLYQAIAPKGNWPPLGDPADSRLDAPRRLLRVVGRHLIGAEDPRVGYAKLSRSKDHELAAVALLLWSYAQSDAGEPEKAAHTLTSRDLTRFDAVERGLLLLQLSVRQAEAADVAAAIATTENAAKVIRKATPRRRREWLAGIAAYNLAAFQATRGFFQGIQDLPPRGDITPLMRNDVLLAEGLTEFLSTSFQRSLANPYSRTITFQAQDPTEARLRGALVRCELLADWHDIRRARRLLGRYLVLSKLGTQGGVPAAALELMRRAGDGDGLKAAARTIAIVGPPAPLRAATSSLLARQDLGASEAVASMRLLEAGADLLPPREADLSARRLMADPKEFAARWNAAPDTLAALVSSSTAGVQSQAAGFVRRLMHADNGALVQNLMRVVAEVRWPEVDEAERSAWLSEIDASFASGTDAHFVSVAAIVGLSTPNPMEIAAFLRRRFEQHPSLDLVSLVVDTSHRLPKWLGQGGWALVADALERVRSDAHAGSFGMGTLDIGDLATAMLLLDLKNEEGWCQLVDFLLDPVISTASKQRAFNRLAGAKRLPPTSARDRLRGSLADIGGVALDLEGTPEGFVAAKLRLASRIGGMASGDILGQLVSLSGSQEPQGRIEAARALPLATRRLDARVTTAIALMLSRDAHPDVKGSAAWSLAQLQRDVSADAIVHQRLVELLSDQGTIVPASAVVGLHEFVLAGGIIDGSTLKIVQRLAGHHISQRVRHSAEALLRETSGSDT